MKKGTNSSKVLFMCVRQLISSVSKYIYIYNAPLLILFCTISLVSCSDSETDTEEAQSEDSEDSEYSNVNGYDAVDLGLSVMWATCNVGASSSSDYGDYYAWGEIETKSKYTESNSVTFDMDDMEDITGNSEYDAATANWGSPWRMPTIDECEELMDKCTWKWTKEDNVYGYTVTGTTGNSIFLPATGYYEGSSLEYDGEEGYYWTSTPYPASKKMDDCYAYFMTLFSDDYFSEYEYRSYGYTIRPVTK